MPLECRCTDSTTGTPWERVDALPIKPSTGEYGYVAKNKATRCTLEELIQQCSKSRVGLVWTTEYERLIPTEESALLADALIKRKKAEGQKNIKIGILNCFTWGSMTLIGWLADGLSASGFLFLLVVTGVVPVASGWRQKRRANLTPEVMLSHERSLARLRLWTAAGNAWATWSITIGLCLVFVLQVVGGFVASIESAGLVKSRVWEGEVWRLATAPLLQGGFITSCSMVSPPSHWDDWSSVLHHGHISSRRSSCAR